MVSSLAACTKTEETNENKTSVNSVATSSLEGVTDEETNSQLDDSTPKADDTKIEKLLNTYLSYRYIGHEDRYADGCGALKLSETDENGEIGSTMETRTYNENGNLTSLYN